MLLGHIIDNCRHPITSYGIILKKNNKYLMIQRMNSLCFIEFIKGRYLLNDTEYLYVLFDNMTESELNIIKESLTYSDILINIFDIKKSNINKKKGNDKFKFLKDSGTLDKLINYSLSNKNKSRLLNEWGFPKGRRNINEVPIQTAIRELYEETGIDESMFKILDVMPLREVFLGTNGQLYKHIYYMAEYLNDENDIFKTFNKNFEISNIGWFTKEECVDNINDYYPIRKELCRQLQ
jgi:ADP-ribose pyrophosphatase YjhB (NUDIX family)